MHLLSGASLSFSTHCNAPTFFFLSAMSLQAKRAVMPKPAKKKHLVKPKPAKSKHLTGGHLADWLAIWLTDLPTTLRP